MTINIPLTASLMGSLKSSPSTKTVYKPVIEPSEELPDRPTV